MKFYIPPNPCIKGGTIQPVNQRWQSHEDCYNLHTSYQCSQVFNLILLRVNPCRGYDNFWFFNHIRIWSHRKFKVTGGNLFAVFNPFLDIAIRIFKFVYHYKIISCKYFKDITVPKSLQQL